MSTNLETIRFQPLTKTTTPEVLNHATESPFRKNNIQFYSGPEGNRRYLTNFTDKGISDFVENNQPEGKKLSATDVKAFLQVIAQDPEKAKNCTFNLADPEIGLLEKDDFNAAHIKDGFTLQVQKTPGTQSDPSPVVSFVDAQESTFDKKSLDDADREYESAAKGRDEIAGKIGDNPQKQLTTMLEDLNTTQKQLASAREDLKRYEKEGSHSAAIGTKIEIKDLEKHEKELKAKLTEEHGGLLATKVTFQQLQEANEKVDALKTKRLRVRQGVTEARKGETVAELPSTPEKVAPKDPKQLPTEDDFKVKKVPAKIFSLRDMNPADQKRFIATMTQPELTVALHQVDDIISQNTKATTDFDGQTKQRVDSYTALKAQLESANKVLGAGGAGGTGGADALGGSGKVSDTTTVPDASVTQPDSDPVTETSAANTPPKKQTETTTVEQPPADAQRPAEALVKIADNWKEALPPGTVTKDGKPFMATNAAGQEAPVTVSGPEEPPTFKFLSVAQQFDILMRVDDEHLKPLLASLTKEQRSAISSEARKVVDKYAVIIQQQQQQVTHTSTATVGSGSSSGSAGTVSSSQTSSEQSSSVVTSSYMSQAYNERAAKILQIIRELDGEETVVTPQPAKETAPVTTAPSNQMEYTIQKGETARQIATKLTGGDQLAATDLIKQILAQNAQFAALLQGLPKEKWPDADLNPTGALVKIMLSRSVSSTNTRDAILSQKPAEQPKANPVPKEQPVVSTGVTQPVVNTTVPKTPPKKKTD